LIKCGTPLIRVVFGVRPFPAAPSKTTSNMNSNSLYSKAIVLAEVIAIKVAAGYELNITRRSSSTMTTAHPESTQASRARRPHHALPGLAAPSVMPMLMPMVMPMPMPMLLPMAAGGRDVAGDK
jgi:hypothetical protein